MIIYVVKWTIRQCDWWQTRLRMLNFCISWCNLLCLLFFHKAAWPQQKRNSPIFIHLSPFTWISNSQITHASLNWISQVLVGWINLQSHGVDGAKEPSAQHIHHLNPFFAFFFFFIPKCNYKLGEGGDWGLGLPSIHSSSWWHQRKGHLGKGPPRLTGHWNVSPSSRDGISLHIQHQWSLGFNPTWTELVWLIKTKQNLTTELHYCICSHIMHVCTNPRVHIHPANCDADSRPRGW